MGNIIVFIEMGGYAAFVWAAYGVAFAVLGGLTLASWRRYRESIATLERLQQGARDRR